MEVQRIRKELDSNTRDKQQVQQRIEDLRISVWTDYEAERRVREERITDLQQQVVALTARQRTTQHSMEQFCNAMGQCKQDLGNLRSVQNSRNFIKGLVWKYS